MISARSSALQAEPYVVSISRSLLEEHCSTKKSVKIVQFAGSDVGPGGGKNQGMIGENLEGTAHQA